MKVTKNLLNEMIEEEINLMIENGELDEGFLDRLRARASGAGATAKGFGRGMLQKGLGGLAAMADEPEMADRMRDKAKQTKAATAGKVAGARAKSLFAKKAKQISRLSLDLAADAKALGLEDVLKVELDGLQRMAAQMGSRLSKMAEE